MLTTTADGRMATATRQQKILLLDSDRPSHGRRLHSLTLVSGGQKRIERTDDCPCMGRQANKWNLKYCLCLLGAILYLRVLNE